MTRFLNILVELAGWSGLLFAAILPGIVFLLGVVALTDWPIRQAIGWCLLASAAFWVAVYGGWYLLGRYRPAVAARLREWFA
jgi:hypothetical protein